MDLKLEQPSESPGRFMNTRNAAPGVSDLVGLGWSLRIDIANKFPGAAAVLWTTFREPLLYVSSSRRNEESGLWCQTPLGLNLVYSI